MTSTVCRRFLITGRVQGVFFRGSTAQQATRLGLRGWARNLPDGSVDVLATGERDAVAKLSQWLQRGPPVARVDNVSVVEVNADDYSHLADFRTG